MWQQHLEPPPAEDCRAAVAAMTAQNAAPSPCGHPRFHQRTDYVHVAMSTCPHAHMSRHVGLYTPQACPVRVCLCVHVCSDVCIHTYGPTHKAMPACAAAHAYTCVQMCAVTPMAHTHMAMPACTDARAYTCVQTCAVTPMTHTYMAMPACTDAHAQMHRPGHRHDHSHLTGILVLGWSLGRPQPQGGPRNPRCLCPIQVSESQACPPIWSWSPASQPLPLATQISLPLPCPLPRPGPAPA